MTLVDCYKLAQFFFLCVEFFNIYTLLFQVMACYFQESCPVFAKPTSGAGAPSQPQQPYTPYPLSNQSSQQPYIPYSTSSAPGMPANPLTNSQLPNFSNYPSLFSNAASQSSHLSGTIQPEHLKASLLSAVEDKIRKRLREKLGIIF